MKSCVPNTETYMKKVSFSSRPTAKVSHLWHPGASRAQPWITSFFCFQWPHCVGPVTILRTCPFICLLVFWLISCGQPASVTCEASLMV